MEIIMDEKKYIGSDLFFVFLFLIGVAMARIGDFFPLCPMLPRFSL
jgi:hypothetical protein